MAILLKHLAGLPASNCSLLHQKSRKLSLKGLNVPMNCGSAPFDLLFATSEILFRLFGRISKRTVLRFKIQMVRWSVLNMNMRFASYLLEMIPIGTWFLNSAHGLLAKYDSYFLARWARCHFQVFGVYPGWHSTRFINMMYQSGVQATLGMTEKMASIGWGHATGFHAKSLANQVVDGAERSCERRAAGGLYLSGTAWLRGWIFFLDQENAPTSCVHDKQRHNFSTLMKCNRNFSLILNYYIYLSLWFLWLFFFRCRYELYSIICSYIHP